MELKTVTVILDDKEAQLFKDFQRHHELFVKLNPHLSLIFGKITLNYAFGELQNVVKEESVWRK